MAVYTNVSSAEIVTLLTQYNIGELIFYKGIAEGVENTNFLLETTQGKFILTIYEKRVEAEELPFFLSIMEWLSERGIPCPLPLHRKDGALVSHLAEKNAAIVTFLSGKSVLQHVENAHMRLLGETLARMHTAAQGFALTRENAMALPGWQRLAQSVMPHLGAIHVGLPKLIADELAFLDKNWPSHLPKGVIHADLFRDNVFFEQHGNELRLSGVIDFYFACVDAFMYDVAITINAWCFDRRHEFNLTRASLLLRHYHEVRPLSDAELNALPILARGAALRFLLTRAYAWLFPVEGALVVRKDPMEYAKKLEFHRHVTKVEQYGF